MKAYNILLLSIITIIRPLFAQEAAEILRMEDAVAIALENNYDIKIAENNKEISTNNAVRANAGFTPTVTANASYNYSNLNTFTEFATANPPIDVNNAGTQNINAGVNLNYTIFNGGANKYNFLKLESQRNISEIQSDLSMENTVNSVILQYLNLVNFKNSYLVNLESVRLSNDRYERAKINYSYGNIGKLELLNAEVDLSNDSSTLVQSRIQFEKSIKDLNFLMGSSPDLEYDIDTSIQVGNDLDINSLMEQALAQNTQFLLQKSQVENTEYDLNIARSQKLPNLSLNGGYSYARSDFDASFIRQSENLGWNAGISLSYNIFDGNRVKRAEQNSKVQIESQAINVEKAENNLRKDMLKAHKDYESSKELMDLRNNSLQLAQANYSRSMDAFNTGQIAGLELREAQLNLLNAKYSLQLQKLQTKIAEVNIYYLAGALLD
jgi:outer membrane protein TolC